MSCSWLFEDRTETWLTTSRSRIGNFPIINNRKGIQQYGWLVKGMLQLKLRFTSSLNLKIKILLAEFINQNDIEEVFWHGVVMPVYTICTCNPKQLATGLQKPSRVLRHLTDDMLLRMKGGTPAFVDSLIKGIDIHSGSAIKKLSYKVKSTGRNEKVTRYI